MKAPLLVAITFAAITSGCAFTPETAMFASTGQLCRSYATQGENFLSPIVEAELQRRGATYCLTPQYIQSQQAAQAQQNAMMLQYGLQMMQQSQPYTVPMNQCVSRYVGQNLVTQCY